MADDLELEQPQQEDTSVRADVLRAFEKHSNPAAADEGTDSSTVRPRNERGQFLPKETVEAQPKADAPAPEPKFTDAGRRVEQVQQPSKAAEPPTSWSADAKAVWSSLPAAAQQAAFKREQEMADGQRQWSEQRQNYERAIAPVAELAQQYQMPVGDAIQRLVTVERRLGNPADAPKVIAELAQAYGVNLAALVNGSQQPNASMPTQAPIIDPNAISRYVEQSVTSKLTEWQAQQQTASLIGDFAGEKSDTGQLAHPFFEEEGVKPLMSQFLMNGHATDMQDAYDKAIWAIPGTREKLLAAQQAPRIEVQRAQVNKAKRAAVSLNGAPGANAPQSSGQANGNSVRDAVIAAWNQHAG